MVMNFQVEHDGTTSSLSYFMVYIYIYHICGSIYGIQSHCQFIDSMVYFS